MNKRWLGLLVVGLGVIIFATGCLELPPEFGDCLCEQTVEITTPALHQDVPLYIDYNENGIYEEDDLVGVYNVYDWNRDITFTWDPDDNEAADAAHTAYRVSLIQVIYDDLEELIELGDFTLNWREIKVAHHFATNPNGRQFTYGAFGFGEDVCFNCPTIIVVLPETYTSTLNPATGTYEYTYTLIPGGNTQSSIPFIFERTPRGGS